MADEQVADSGAQLDTLFDSINDAPATEIPMSQAPAQPTPAQQAVSEIEFAWNGKQIKAPMDKAKMWASQGYDYAQKMHTFKQQMAEFEKQQAQVREMEAAYKDVDAYVRQNPEWWQHVQNQYQQQTKGSNGANDPVLSELNALKQEIAEFKGFKNEIVNKEKEQQIKAQDQALDAQIQDIRKQYANLPWDTVNEEGKSLETQVLEYANQHNIPSFKAAFSDFYLPQLIKMAEERAKENLGKTIQAQTKLGLLGETATPSKGLKPAQNYKTKSYNELAQEGLVELGLTGG